MFFFLFWFTNNSVIKIKAHVTYTVITVLFSYLHIWRNTALFILCLLFFFLTYKTVVPRKKKEWLHCWWERLKAMRCPLCANLKQRAIIVKRKCVNIFESGKWMWWNNQKTCWCWNIYIRQMITLLGQYLISKNFCLRIRAISNLCNLRTSAHWQHISGGRALNFY